MDPQKHRADVLGILDGILGRPVERIDVERMSLDERRRVSADALSALRNPVLVAIFGKASRAFPEGETTGMVVEDMSRGIARAAKSFEEVDAMRNTIFGIECVKRMLVDLSFADPDSRKASEPYSAI
jgi:hypothetical protein